MASRFWRLGFPKIYHDVATRLNALAETIIGLFKTEVIRRSGPCHTACWEQWPNGSYQRTKHEYSLGQLAAVDAAGFLALFLRKIWIGTPLVIDSLLGINTKTLGEKVGLH